MTFSTYLRTNLAGSRRFIATFRNRSRFDADRFSLQVLPVELPLRRGRWRSSRRSIGRWSPVAERFIESIRQVVKPLAGNAGSHRANRPNARLLKGRWANGSRCSSGLSVGSVASQRTTP